ncbi:MAG: hypothetical protein WKF71_09040 [Pyrinomonadaceae bacterium]
MEEVKITAENLSLIHLWEEKRGDFYLISGGSSQLLFTENATNFEKLYGGKNESPFAKDGINDFVVTNKKEAINPKQTGTKASVQYVFNLPPQSSKTVYLRLSSQQSAVSSQQFKNHGEFTKDCENVFIERKKKPTSFMLKSFQII